MDYTFQMTLAKWLDLATQELVPDARRRIRAEIETHYADAFTAAREAGLSDAEADRTALAALGDPYAAWYRFRKTCLCEAEERQLEKMKQYYDMPRRQLFTLAGLSVVLLLLIVALAFWSMKHADAKYLILWAGYFLVKATGKLHDHLQARLLFDPRLEKAVHIYTCWVMPIQTIFLIAVTGLFIFSIHAHHSGDLPGMLAPGLLLLLLVIGFISGFYGFLPLLRKVRGRPSSSSPMGPDQHA